MKQKKDRTDKTKLSREQLISKGKEWLIDNYRIAVPAFVCVLLVVVVGITVLAGMNKDEKNAKADNGLVSENGTIAVPDVLLEENAYDNVNQFVNIYYTALASGDVETFKSMRSYTDDTEVIRMEKKSNYIESYNNIKVYTKPGPVENSFVAYVYYEVKFDGINTMAPGLNTLYICTNESGALYVYSGETDENITAYMQAISTQDDVMDLFNKVQVTYNEAVDADETLKTFLDELSAKLKTDVGEALAALEAGQTVSDNTVSDNAVSENVAEPVVSENVAEQPAAETPTTETVRTTDVVNVRSSDSETADKVGKTEQGATYTRLQVLDNGWSKIDYEGTEAYVKSEYLEVVQASIGTVSVLENVNIRSSDSETAEKVGIAYAGETYELLENLSNGWSKVTYNGTTAYIKTEYLQAQ